MFAKQSKIPTAYQKKSSVTSSVKLTFVAVDKRNNPAVDFEFSDSGSAQAFFKKWMADLDDFVGNRSPGIDHQSFVLRKYSENLLKFSLRMKLKREDASEKDFLRHAHIFSMVHSCIEDYRADVLQKSFYLKGQFGDAAVEIKHIDPAVFVLQDLARVTVSSEMVARDLRFEIGVDITGLDKRSQDYYEKLLALEVEKTRLTKAYEAKEELVTAEKPPMSSSPSFGRQH